jgi:hypothetical protein
MGRDGLNAPTYYIFRHEQYWGPYRALDLDDFHREGLLGEDDEIWNAEIQEWTPFRDVRIVGDIEVDARGAPPSDSATPAALPHGCRTHPAAPAVAVCFTCDVPLCAPCLRMVADKFYCFDCHWEARKRASGGPGPAAAGSGVATSLGRIVSANPLAGPLLILLVVICLKFTLGERRWEKVDGIVEAKTTGFFYKALRTAGRGFTLPKGHVAVERSFTSSRAALDEIIRDVSVSRDVKAACVAMKIQLSLFRDTSAELGGDLAEFKKYSDAPRGDRLTRFFQACRMHFIESRHAEAARELEDLRYNRIPIASWNILPDEIAIFEIEAEEMLYLLGDCHLRAGNRLEARRAWMRIGTSEHWKDLAARRMR